MAAVLIGAIVVALVLAVAAGAIGREARRLDTLPPRTVFDVDEAVVWVADRLPDDVTAELSYEDVRVLLELGLERFGAVGLAGATTGERIDAEVVISERDLVTAVIDAALERGLEATPHDVQAVVEAQMAYLTAIAAVGPAADETDDVAPPAT